MNIIRTPTIALLRAVVIIALPLASLNACVTLTLPPETDLIPGVNQRGYVEFYVVPLAIHGNPYVQTLLQNSMIPLRSEYSTVPASLYEIFRVDNQRKEKVGALANYRGTTNHLGEMWRRVAIPPGEHTFWVEITLFPGHQPPVITSGRRTIKVVEGMTTLVRIEAKVEEVFYSKGLIKSYTGFKYDGPHLIVTSHIPAGSDERAVQLLGKALKDPDWTVRLHAARALGEIRDINVVETLTDALKDEIPAVRIGAAGSLMRFRDGKTVDMLLPVLVEMLDDYPWGGTAVEFLGDIGDKRAIDPLKKCVDKSRAYMWSPSKENIEKACPFWGGAKEALRKIEKANPEILK